MTKRFALLFLLLLALVPPLFAQEQPPQVVITAVNDLSNRLGQTVTNYNFTFEQFTYPDNTLGCDIAPVTPTPGNVSGYQISITFQNVTYDYRVSADSTIVFPCDANLLQATPVVPPATPAGTTPTSTTSGTPIPCPTGFAGLLPPRVNLNQQARVTTTSGVPNRLRSAPSLNAEQIGQINAGETVTIIGGPSCADNIVWWQVSFGSQIGWTAEGLPPDIYYLEPVGDAGVSPTAVPPSTDEATVEATLEPLPETTVETIPLPDFASLVDNVISLYDFTADGSAAQVGMITEPPLGDFDLLQDMAWSFNGVTLGYVISDFDEQTSQTTYSLYVSDASGTNPVQVATDLYYTTPVAFATLDGSEIIYARSGGEVGPAESSQVPGGGAEPVQFFSQPISGTAEDAVLIGEIQFGVGCGGGASYPAVSVFQMEAGYGGRGLILDLTPSGLLYSTNCTGSGTALLDTTTGESVELGTNLSRMSVSPDETQAVAIADDEPSMPSGTLVLVDLATQQVTPITTSALPDQVAFGFDGFLYYSVRTETGIIAGSDADSEALRNVGIPYTGLPAYEVALYRIRPDGTEETQIFSSAGYGIGRILPAPDGSVSFSVVPNGEAWVEAVATGTLDPTTISFAEQQAFIAPTLYRLLAGETTPAPVGDGFFMVALNTAALAAVGP
jgi:hypothetical protein